MTGASPVTTILTTTAWLCHATPSIVVTGASPVMLPTAQNAMTNPATLILMRMGRNELPPLPNLNNLFLLCMITM